MTPPIVTFMGHMRMNHGFRIIPELIREIRTRLPAVHCRIHLGAISRQFDLEPYRQLQVSGVAKVTAGWRKEHVMVRLLREATVLVLPYHRDNYREMVSAVFCNAVAFGKPCVVPTDTWMAQQISMGKGAGIAYNGNDVPDIADAVCSVIREAERYLAKGAACLEPWRSAQSGERLLARILEWAGAAAPDQS